MPALTYILKGTVTRILLLIRLLLRGVFVKIFILYDTFLKS